MDAVKPGEFDPVYVQCGGEKDNSKEQGGHAEQLARQIQGGK